MAAAFQDGPSALAGTRGGLAQQARLADARLPNQEKEW
jgi:hypothetical protein